MNSSGVGVSPTRDRVGAALLKRAGGTPTPLIMHDLNQLLHVRWDRLLEGIGSSRERRVVFDALVDAYSERHRHYHTLDHIAACLAEFDRLPRDAFADSISVELAIWFHDSVYDPRGKFNEKRSAEFADACLNRFKTPQAFRRAVRELILVTDHKIAPRRPDGKLLVDIDLAIFGQDEATFASYERAIRAEYAFVADELYRFARANVLKKFLHRPSVYQTSFFQSRYEAAARTNLRSAIRRLVGT